MTFLTRRTILSFGNTRRRNRSSYALADAADRRLDFEALLAVACLIYHAHRAPTVPMYGAKDAEYGYPPRRPRRKR